MNNRLTTSSHKQDLTQNESGVHTYMYVHVYMYEVHIQFVYNCIVVCTIVISMWDCGQTEIVEIEANKRACTQYMYVEVHPIDTLTLINARISPKKTPY